MPVIIVTAPPLPGVGAVLVELNTAVAAALGLPPDGVHSMAVTAVAAATGLDPVPAWPTAVLHGGPRPEPLMQAAVAAAEKVLRQAWQTPDVWVQWNLAGA